MAASLVGCGLVVQRLVSELRSQVGDTSWQLWILEFHQLLRLTSEVQVLRLQGGPTKLPEVAESAGLPLLWCEFEVHG